MAWAKLNGLERSPGVYRITCLVNGRVYFGIAKVIGDRVARHRSLLRAGRHDNALLQLDYDRYGESAFIVEPLHIIADSGERAEVETALIESNYGDGCYNIRKRAGHQTLETCEKIAAAHRGKKCPQHVIDRLRDANIGRSPPNKGQKASAETREKLRQSHLGKKQPPELVAKRAASLKRNPNYLSNIAKARAAFTAESARKISESMKRVWAERRAAVVH